MPHAALELGVVAGDRRREAVALRADGEQIATLLVPVRLSAEVRQRMIEQVVPSVEALIAIGLKRDALQDEAVQTAALRRSDDLKTALLRSVSHDLRTPLTAILTAGYALGSESLTDEERRDLSDAIVEEAQRLSTLVEKLLDLSKLQSGRAAPRREWTSLDEVLVAAAESAGVIGDMQFSLDSGLPPLRADAAQLERAFANVMENAARHGGGHPVSVRARLVGSRLMVRIVDRGPGISEHERDRIFEAFHRSPDADPRHGGAGLGLAIAKGFIEANGGSIWVESLPGQGTSFVVAFAMAAPDGAGSRPRAGAGRRCSDGMSDRARILVVDDEPQIVRALKVILRDGGYEAIVAESVEEALDRAAVRPPDAAIIDLVLPDGSGVDLCRRLREWTEMPIIVLSAVGEEDAKVDALAAGADDYVTKPFGPRELLARLAAALRRAGPGADRADDRRRRARGRPRRTIRPSRRRGRASDADRVRPAAGAGPQPRAADDPPSPAHRGLGPGVRRRHAGPAHPHRQPAPQDRSARRRRRAEGHSHRSGRRLPVRGLTFTES